MRPGDLAFGRFTVEAKAGSGGMGTVYRAVDNKSGDAVALKVLRFRDEEDADRFDREASVLASIAHPAIVRYVAHGTSSDHAFLAMEWLEGEDLGARLSREGLTPAEGLLLGRRVAEALAVLHRAGIVHRDVKPRNLFLCEGWIERVKLLDFGIARFTRAQLQMTVTGAMLGTPGYMAPEQARGDRDVDARADVFSLGCVLFRCIAGRPAFTGDNVIAVLAKTILEETPRLVAHRSDIPADLDDLVARFLSKEREHRPRDGAAALAELTSVSAMPVAIAAALPAAPALGEDERRVVSIVLAGGSEALRGETMATPALEARETALSSLATSFGGHLDFLADGSLMVTVAGSGAATDLAARSARCALAMRALLPGVPMALATGAGVRSGTLRGSLGSQPLGALVDRGVSLLEPQAPTRKATEAHATKRSGEPSRREAPPNDLAIRLDEATAGLLDVRFHVESDALGLRLLGEREIVEAQRTLLGRPYPCVGRDREIAMLEAMYDECVEEPIARCALVTGAAGRGKSRVRFELLQRLKSRETPPLVLFARGDTVSAGAAFGMIAPAILREAGVFELEPIEVKRLRLRARVARVVAAHDAPRVAEFLGEFVGIAPETPAEPVISARGDPLMMGDAMLASFLTFLEAELRAHPVVLVLEDLHWGDLPSVRFVDAALARLADKPLFVLAVARTEVHATFPGLFSEREVQEIRLSTLTKKQSERLARDVLGDAVGEGVIARIVERAGGNAFYLEELIRAVAQGMASADLPDTVLGMVQARLDALGVEAKRVLRAASVFGQTFQRGGVIALLGGDERSAGVKDWLDELVSREVIAARGDAGRGGETEYVFRHALLRDAAYAMLTDADRELGHRLAAEWLERERASDPIVLAEHFVRGDAPARAVGWFRRAAELALEGNDLDGAVAAAERGVACGAEGESRGALKVIACEALRWRGDVARALETGREAADILEPGSDLWHRVVGELIALAAARADVNEMERWSRAARDAPRSPTPNAHVTSLCRAVYALLQAGRRADADDLLDLVQELAPSLSRLDRAVAARVHAAWAMRASVTGHIGAALRSHEAALAAWEAAGDARNAALTRSTMGYLQGELGAFERAETSLRQALAAAEKMNLTNVAGWSLSNLGKVLCRLKRFREARGALERAIAISEARRGVRLEIASRVYLAEVLRSMGDVEGASAEARRALDRSRTLPPLEALAEAMFARVALEREGAAAALEHASAAMALLETIDAVEGDAFIRYVHARSLIEIGDEARARAALAVAKERLLSRAAKLEDRRQQKGLLADVFENKETLVLAERFGV